MGTENLNPPTGNSILPITSRYSDWVIRAHPSCMVNRDITKNSGGGCLYVLPATLLIRINKIIEQVNMFNYLGNMISYEKELDIDNKLHNYLKITGILNNVFKPEKNS